MRMDNKQFQKNMKETCNKCSSLLKLYPTNDSISFRACCKKSLVNFGQITKPRTIVEKTGPMLEIETPDWCPTKRGVVKEIINGEKQPLLLPPPSQTYKPMTYSEKREKMMNLPKRLNWDEIEENGIYVIPKNLSQTRKVIRVIFKNEYSIRYSVIDEYGEESKTLSSIYPKDIDAIFITKILKY